jgi:hypothetical protein
LTRPGAWPSHVASQQQSCGIAAQINSPRPEILEPVETEAYLRGTLHRNME